MLAGEFELLVGRGAGDDTGAHDLADLDGGEPGAAGGAEHDQRFAGLEPGAYPQRIERRAVGDGEARGAVEIERVGDLHQDIRRHRDCFACRAPAGIAHHPVAGRHIGHARADAFDNSGEFRRGRERKRRLVLIFAGDDQRVEEIQRRGFDAHHGFAGSGVRLGHINEFEFVGRAELAAENGFHAEFISGFSGFGHARVEECAAQPAEGKPQPRLHRAERQFRARGNFCV